MQMPVWCSARYCRHQRALQWLGFLVERKFTLNNRTISGCEPFEVFRDLMRAHFPDGDWSCAALGKQVVVIAPKGQIPQWERFVSEFDREAA